MTIAYIGLGANLGKPQTKIQQALAAIDGHADIRLLDKSSLYKSKAIGLTGQPDYINAAAKLEMTLTPHSLLHELLTIETMLGRTRDGTHWGPRIIDIDLLYCGDQIINDETLVLPHPEILNRDFVLYPLAEMEPNFTLPDGRMLSDITNTISEQGLKRISP